MKEAPKSETKKLDRRVVRSRKRIKEAFSALLATTPYPKITVSAIAREAGINRKTFYLHYTSVDDLLHAVIEDESIAVGEAVDLRLEAAEYFDAHKVIRAVLEVLDARPTFTANVARNLPAGELLELAMVPVHRIIVEKTAEAGVGIENIDELSTALDYYLAGYLGSISFAYVNWVSAPDPKPNLDELTGIIYQLLSGQTIVNQQVLVR